MNKAISQQFTDSRQGLSLVEIMIAMVMTLIILGAMMSAFSYGSAEMQKGRAAIELNNRLISAEDQLRRDLSRITVDLKPHHRLPALPKGYAEINDGPEADYISTNDDDLVNFAHGGNEMLFGDRDDVFACTIKSDGKAFRGRLGNDIVESHLAEVVWYTVPNIATADVSDRVLCRRQLLILPNQNLTGFTAGDAFFRNNDISARIVAGALIANSLTDLSLRGNRYCHAVAGTNPAVQELNTGLLATRNNDNHVMVSDLAAFDIKVFAPDASPRVISTGAGDQIIDIAEPSDIGSRKPTGLVGMPLAVSGAFVDLAKGSGILGGGMNSTLNCNYAARFTANSVAVYDTGTSQYNRNQNNDNGANGVDGDSDSIVDEADEQDSIAPYDAPIRGLEFTFRVLEPNTKQVRQLSVIKSFVPE